MQCDAQGAPGGLGEEGVLQAGWVRVSEYWNLNVNSTGINVHIVAGLTGAIQGRENAEQTLPGPLFDVEQDYLFGDDTNIRPDNDLIMTLGNLRDGFYRIFSYNNRPDEHPTPISEVTVEGAASVVSVPESYMQDHLIMTIPVQILFEAGGGDIVIRYGGPSTSGVGPEPGRHSGQAYINGFTLEFFGASNEAAYDPSPPDRAEQLCMGFDLSWTPGTSANSHEIYFGSDINDVDPNASPSLVETVVGSTSWTPPALQAGTTYYWRVDEVTATDTWPGAIWRFSTNDGNAFDPVPADGWRGIATDADLSWSAGCDANSYNVYFGTSESNVAGGTGGTDQGNQEETSFDPGTLSANTDYYWRIEGVNEAEATTWPGEVWTFKTGSGVEGSLMYFKFDDTLGASVPSPVTDSTGNETFTSYDPCGTLVYGDSNPVINPTSGTSVDFSTGAGLYRDSNVPGDPLVLDGYQYTLECWVNPDVLVDPVGDLDIREHGVTLIGRVDPTEDLDDDVGNTDYWGLELSLPAGAIFFHSGRETDRENMFVYSGRNTVAVGEWHHIAGVFDLSDPAASMKIYLNGQLKASSSRPSANPPDTNSLPISIGFRRTNTGGRDGDYFEGLIDEVRISNYALDPADFLLVPGPEWARSPSPGNGVRRVDPNVVLSWVPGDEVQDPNGHDVYFGTDYDNVLGATTSDAEYVGNIDANGFDPLGPAPLDFGTRYHWRIDEINDTDPNIWKGIVWSFIVVSEIDDPNVILWYKFDETSGSEAFDSSGHDYFGDVFADDGPSWDPNDGDSGSLIFDNDASVSVPGDMLGNVLNGVSVAVWLKGAYSGGDNWLLDSASAGDIDMQLAVPDGDGAVYWRVGNDSNDVLTWDMGRDGVDPETLEDWHHWAFIKGEAVSEISVYFDGQMVESNDLPAETLMFLRDTPVRIGTEGDSDAVFEGKVDDFKVFDYPLSESDVIALFRRGDVERAWAPDPRKRQIDVDRNAELSWRPGDSTAGHDVYLGTDFNDVNDATTSTAGIYKPPRLTLGTQTYDPGGLALGTTYYWRVDEVNDPNIWKGAVWSFTVAPYVTIDDFEAYDNSTNKIFNTWEDGNVNLTGSFLDLGTEPFDPAHGGYQSMLYIYDNTIKWDWDHYWSEAALPFDPAMDFTTGGETKVVTLYFYGDPGNDANDTEELYVGITGSLAEVRYSDDHGNDNDDLKLAEWTEWNIPVSDFIGADPCAVTSLLIGFGDRDNTDAVGGDGVVYIDDIRLHPSRCVPEILKPAADLSNDCIVSWADVAVLGDQWLRADLDLTPVSNPGTANLVGHWELDDGSGDTATDSGPYANHGTLEGDVAWIAGKIGSGALAFDGGRVLVPDHSSLKPADSVAAMAWIHFSSAQNSARAVVKGADNRESYELEVDGDDTLVWVIREDSNTESFPRYAIDSESLRPNEWMYIAGTYDSNHMTLYINGQVVATDTIGAITISQDSNGLAIGNRSDDTNRQFDGDIDDVRVYDRALTGAEVGYFASEGDGEVELDSEANLFTGEAVEVINIRDAAVLLDHWLEEKLWPE
jgi:hypothetical protein